MSTDPRIEAVTNLLKQYTRSGIDGSIGFGASVADIIAAADSVDPLRGRKRFRWRRSAGSVGYGRPTE